MKPIGALMREHRVIEQVVAALGRQSGNIKLSGEVDTVTMRQIIDFFRKYADELHHGKEEKILFKQLAARPLLAEQRRLMEELIAEHGISRRLVATLADATEKYAAGDTGAVPTVLDSAAGLLKLYPEHIRKEDKQFFFPSMAYFTDAEQQRMLVQFREIDKSFRPEIYVALARELAKTV